MHSKLLTAVVTIFVIPQYSAHPPSDVHGPLDCNNGSGG